MSLKVLLHVVWILDTMIRAPLVPLRGSRAQLRSLMTDAKTGSLVSLISGEKIVPDEGEMLQHLNDEEVVLIKMKLESWQFVVLRGEKSTDAMSRMAIDVYQQKNPARFS